MSVPKTKKQGEKIVAWLQTTPLERPAPEDDDPSPETLAEYERYRRADTYIREHGSVAVVVPMLMKQYGYSEATARRDILIAQEKFGELDSHPKAYYAKMMIDLVNKVLIECVKDRKWREFPGISKELREWMGYAETAGSKDPKALLNEVTRVIRFDPGILGVERNPNVLEETRKIIEQKTGKPFKMPEFPDEPEAGDE